MNGLMLLDSCKRFTVWIMGKSVQTAGDLIHFVDSPKRFLGMWRRCPYHGGGGCGLIAALAAAEKGANGSWWKRRKRQGATRL